MQSRLSLLRQTARALGEQFRNHQLRDFVPRRVDELVALAEATPDAVLQEARAKRAEEQVAAFGRQLAIQNAYWNERSVLEG